MTEMCFVPTPSSASLLSPPLSTSWREREGGEKREGGRERREREGGREGRGRKRGRKGGRKGGREGREREKEGGREGEREGRRVTETSLKKPQNGNVRPNL